MPQPKQARFRSAAHSTLSELRRVQGKEWWLWGFAVVVTLLLTAGLLSVTSSIADGDPDNSYNTEIFIAVRGLAALVLMFDIYTLYQNLQLYRIRRQLSQRDQLFRIISENAADMIALVDTEGKRLYNSPAYEKVLGYTSAELQASSALEQVHPDDRAKVLAASEKARRTGVGERLEYRIRHKDGSWRILESVASSVRNEKNEIDRLVIVNRDITERRRAEEMVVHTALHDGLTNLPNRLLFLEHIKQAIAHYKRHPEFHFAVLCIDIDEFKRYNESLGHKVGDRLLVEIASRLRASLRRDDTLSRPLLINAAEMKEEENVARLGGDEFTVLIGEIKNPSDAIKVGERIQEKLSAPFLVNNDNVVISASIGIALNTNPQSTAEDLLRDANLAMYRAKHLGRSRCEVFDTKLHAAALRRLKLETELRSAVEQKEFVPFYQPIVSLCTQTIIGFEVLVRWLKDGELIPPGAFINVAEETGLVIPMNRFLMMEACQQIKTWNEKYPLLGPFLLSANVTGKQFAQPSLTSEISLVLRESGLPPQLLQLEILETVAMGDTENGDEVLAQLKQLGVRLTIDDFGTGYSSLHRLQRLPVDSLKVDRSFISNMLEDKEAKEVVRIIVMLAHNLGLKVVAEGVEMEEQINELMHLHCDFAQGYFLCRPGNKDTMEDLLIGLSEESSVNQPGRISGARTVLA